MSEKQNASDTVTVLPPSPYGICFDLKTDRFQLEEATRSGSFDMKYRHYHSTYEIYYLFIIFGFTFCFFCLFLSTEPATGTFSRSVFYFTGK